MIGKLLSYLSLNAKLLTWNCLLQFRFVYSIIGKKLIDEKVNAGIDLKQLDISSLNAGVYNVVLIQDNKKQNLKLVKQ